ncbi:MAG TPA: hypothetical protein VL403_20255 [Candidatus Kryptonia bacterium]|nr:hypothetical protein [Candidatus Kryptonia bacterium]
MATPSLPKMMLGFVVRRCTVALGHAPSPKEFAAWANAQHDNRQSACIFGRPISEREAALILRHPDRPVSARSAAPHEQVRDAQPGANVVSFDRGAKRRAFARRGR